MIAIFFPCGLVNTPAKLIDDNTMAAEMLKSLVEYVFLYRNEIIIETDLGVRYYYSEGDDACYNRRASENTLRRLMQDDLGLQNFEIIQCPLYYRGCVEAVRKEQWLLNRIARECIFNNQ